MSQSRQAAPDAAPAFAPPAASAPANTPTKQAGGSTPAKPASQSAQRFNTPQLLRRLTSALILTGLLVSLAGLASFAGLAAALNRAEDNAKQLIRVQKIQTNLLSADATATNAFLVGGLEPPAQRSSYDQAIDSSTSLIAEASDAQPADAAALSALNRAVVDYAVTIEQARANNRQGFPVGSQYLRNASADLRSDALPLLDNLVRANSSRADQSMGSKLGLIFPIAALLALGALVASMVWVARRFRRRINSGLLAAAAVLLVSLISALVLLGQVASQVAEIRNGSYSSLNAAADVRINANNAKSNESLTLIARGSGASFQKAWLASAQTVEQRLGELPTGLGDVWATYATAHQQIRRLDDGGQWDAAVRLATGADQKSANTRFTVFDQEVTRFLDTASANTANGLGSLQPLLIVAATLSFLAGLAAALLARTGLAERLREYR